jgi:hypothetical protein
MDRACAVRSEGQLCAFASKAIKCEMWWKDRAEKDGRNPVSGCVLTENYVHLCRRVAFAPTKTRSLMAEIALNQLGGWLSVFSANTGGAE